LKTLQEAAGQDCHEIGDTFELKRVNLTQLEKKVKP